MNARLDHGAVAAPRRQPVRTPRPDGPERPERRGRPAPPLHVVRPEERRQARRVRRRARLAALATVLTVGVGLFGVVALHVVLTQNQFRLDRLRRNAAVEQSRYEPLRLQVAQPESPERIVATAQERLGMVVPPDVRSLTPPPAAAPAKGSSNEQSEARPPD